MGDSGRMAKEALFSSLRGDELIAPLLPDFVANLQQVALQIESAAANNEMPLVAEFAHKVKGAARMYGFGIISDHALAVEDALRSQPVEAQRAAIRELLATMRAAQA